MVDSQSPPQWIASIAGSASAITAAVTYVNSRIASARMFARSVILDLEQNGEGAPTFVVVKNLSDQVIADVKIRVNGMQLERDPNKPSKIPPYLVAHETDRRPIPADYVKGTTMPKVVLWFIDVRGSAWNMVLGELRPKRILRRPFMKGR